MNAKEKEPRHVLDWWREVIEGGHMELTTKYQADDYIQHNPNVPTGRAAFVNFFQNVVGVKPKNPIPATLTPARRHRRERRLRVPDLRAEAEGSDRRHEDLSLELVRGPAPRERQGSGTLGQREASSAAAGAPKPARSSSRST